MKHIFSALCVMFAGVLFALPQSTEAYTYTNPYSNNSYNTYSYSHNNYSNYSYPTTYRTYPTRNYTTYNTYPTTRYIAQPVRTYITYPTTSYTTYSNYTNNYPYRSYSNNYYRNVRPTYNRYYNGY